MIHCCPLKPHIEAVNAAPVFTLLRDIHIYKLSLAFKNKCYAILNQKARSRSGNYTLPNDSPEMLRLKSYYTMNHFNNLINNINQIWKMY